jgi:phosphatidylserine/phosphatidylglycerophosphate/cardiolipin synthase-like enzyme
MDKRLVIAIFIIGCLTGSIVTISYVRITSSQLEVFFSPNGGCEQVIIHYISNAKSYIHILMFSFTLDSVADALIASHERGVEVKALFEYY